MQAGEIFIQETPIAIEEMVPKLQAIAKQGYEERIFVRGDKMADYGTVMKVMARISSAGFKNLGLVSLPEAGWLTPDERSDRHIGNFAHHLSWSSGWCRCPRQKSSRPAVSNRCRSIWCRSKS